MTDDICTHGNASSSEGEIEEGKVYCPFHDGAFDIRTGKRGCPMQFTSANIYGAIRRR